MTTTPPRCKWDRDTSTYLRPDGHPCKTDDYGDPTHHCTNRRCTHHIAKGEQTCARCIHRARGYLKNIADKSKLMHTAALAEGVNSEAMNLAGPAADYETFSARRRLDKEWIYNNVPERHILKALRYLLADDDAYHPFNVLGRWDIMVRAHYSHPLDDVVTIASAAAYLDRQLARIAQDADQDFPQFYAETKRCAQHLDAVLKNSDKKDRGAPCPDCTSEDDGVGKRLVREYGHWCYEDACERIHYIDETGDRWICPTNATHIWSHEAYINYVEDRKTA